MDNGNLYKNYISNYFIRIQLLHFEIFILGLKSFPISELYYIYYVELDRNYFYMKNKSFPAFTPLFLYKNIFLGGINSFK